MFLGHKKKGNFLGLFLSIFAYEIGDSLDFLLFTPGV